MKKNITAAAIKNQFKNIIKVGYCDLQTVLSSFEPNYYTSGIYGWNADVYQIAADTVIVTGYRPFGNIKPDRAIIDLCESTAKRNARDYNMTWDQRKNANHEIIRDLIGMLTR